MSHKLKQSTMSGLVAPSNIVFVTGYRWYRPSYKI